jgi:hypothetical protein
MVQMRQQRMITEVELITVNQEGLLKDGILYKYKQQQHSILILQPMSHIQQFVVKFLFLEQLDKTQGHQERFLC